jgi:hypothetical protein
MTYIEIPLNLEIVMFGLLHPYDANLIKNKIILLTKLYIFRTKVNEGMVNPLLLFCKEKCLFPICYG